MSVGVTSFEKKSLLIVKLYYFSVYVIAIIYSTGDNISIKRMFGIRSGILQDYSVWEKKRNSDKNNILNSYPIVAFFIQTKAILFVCVYTSFVLVLTVIPCNIC